MLFCICKRSCTVILCQAKAGQQLAIISYAFAHIRTLVLCSAYVGIDIIVLLAHRAVLSFRDSCVAVFYGCSVTITLVSKIKVGNRFWCVSFLKFTLKRVPCVYRIIVASASSHFWTRWVFCNVVVDQGRREFLSEPSEKNYTCHCVCVVVFLQRQLW